MNDIKVNNFGSYGYASVDGKATISFSIMGAADILSIEEDKQNFASKAVVIGDRLTLEGYTVATHGLDNQLPLEVKVMLNGNPILPEILKKQVRMMYGHGPGLYFDEETADNKRQRTWVTKKYPDVLAWLNSWDRDAELDSFPNYAKRIIHEYYYMEGYFNQWKFNLSRRTGGSMPIRGLKALQGTHCRLATSKLIDPRDQIFDKDCDLVLVADWRQLFRFTIAEYNRLDTANPLKYPSVVNYVRDRGFDEEIYSNPTYYYGLKEWIKGSNLNPKYINSYLRNSLSAKIHVIIPDAWIREKQSTLERICNQNQKLKDDNKPIITEYEGITIGTEFNFNLLTELVNKKIADATGVLSGTGENQGKAFWSRSFLGQHGIENWKFEEIPTKYSEFVKSITEYNKESTKMILAGKGLDPAISSLSNEGVFSSGAQVYYSYLVYLDTLGYAEEFILEDVNRALWINFPALEKANIKIGFYRYAPERQADTAPNDRLNTQTK